MRILVVHPHLYVVGGSEILTKILVYELASQGHEVVVCTHHKRDDLFPEAKNVHFEYFKEVPEMKGRVSEITWRIMNLHYTFEEVLRKWKPHVVLLMIQEPIYAVLMKAVKPEMGVAMYIHYPFEEELTPENLKKFIEMYRFPNLYGSFYRVVDIHMTNSNYTAKALHKHFGIESNVVYPAVDWDYFSDEIDVKEERENIIVSVGRFVPQKRHDVLIELFAKKIKPVVKDAKLLIVGIKDARYEDYYEKLIEMVNEVPDIEIVDRALSPKEMRELYRKAKIYVHMRIGEHFGMAPVEAMSQGAIPILPRKSGLAELITQGRNGFTFESDDEVTIYVNKLLQAPKEEIVAMRKYAYRSAWYFNPDRFAKEVLNYLKLLTESE